MVSRHCLDAAEPCLSAEAALSRPSAAAHLRDSPVGPGQRASQPLSSVISPSCCRKRAAVRSMESPVTSQCAIDEEHVLRECRLAASGAALASRATPSSLSTGTSPLPTHGTPSLASVPTLDEEKAPSKPSTTAVAMCEPLLNASSLQAHSDLEEHLARSSEASSSRYIGRLPGRPRNGDPRLLPTEQTLELLRGETGVLRRDFDLLRQEGSVQKAQLAGLSEVLGQAVRELFDLQCRVREHGVCLDEQGAAGPAGVAGSNGHGIVCDAFMVAIGRDLGLRLDHQSAAIEEHRAQIEAISASMHEQRAAIEAAVEASVDAAVDAAVECRTRERVGLLLEGLRREEQALADPQAARSQEAASSEAGSVAEALAELRHVQDARHASHEVTQASLALQIVQLGERRDVVDAAAQEALEAAREESRLLRQDAKLSQIELLNEMSRKDALYIGVNAATRDELHMELRVEIAKFRREHDEQWSESMERMVQHVMRELDRLKEIERAGLQTSSCAFARPHC